MTKTIDTRLSLLEMISSDSEKVIILDKTRDCIYYIDIYGDYHEISEDQYQSIKDDVTTITLEYAARWRGSS